MMKSRKLARRIFVLCVALGVCGHAAGEDWLQWVEEYCYSGSPLSYDGAVIAPAGQDQYV